MAKVTRKTEVEPIDGTPVKRMFWSIISDYDLRTGLCELVDNALDLWMQGDKKKPLNITINLDASRQMISVNDDAGGVRRDELRLLVAPGGSRNDPKAAMIGIFGVGSKRAGIALGEHVEIRTRFRKQQTFEVDITKEWLESDDWELPSYEIPDIEPATTRVEISQLRKPFSIQDVDELVVHFGETYDWFLRNGCDIRLNGDSIAPVGFETWAFPRGFAPRFAEYAVDLGDGNRIATTITAGLIRDRDPERENYGVYFYCNHRLIAKELKTREVGYFVTGEAGVPHPDASLCRVIVRMQGGAQLMPWNSSKSGINFGHMAFHQLRPILIRLVSHYSSLSRRFKNEWEGKVFRHETGTIEEIPADEVSPGGRMLLPQLPRVNKARYEQLKAKNKGQIRRNPWTLGLVEAISAVEILGRQRLETRNRMALILLDSNFEIALKEFIVHRDDLFPPNQYSDSRIQNLFRNRPQVISEVTGKMAIPKELLDKARHYYGLRNKLIHERATVGITDADVTNYRSTIEKLLGILFKLKF